MRAVWIPKYGGPEVLEVRETPDPEPAKGEVRIAVEAAGLNFAEMMARQGLYPDAPKAPCVVGYEVAGTVEAVGAGASLKAGTRVVAMTRFGGHAEKVCVAEHLAHPMPEDMSFEEGAALPVNYLTAYHMLFRVACLRPADKVLIHMAAGGVGTAALQLCRTVAGVETFGTASPSKHERLRENGCDHPIDYRSRDYVKAVREVVGERGVDIVLDALGGRDWKRGYSLLRSSGHLVAFGFANMASGSKRNIVHVLRQLAGVPRFNPMTLMSDNRGVSGVNLGHLWHESELMGEEMAALLTLYREGKIKPHVDSTFAFERAADAHRRLQDRQNIGKVVLVPR